MERENLPANRNKEWGILQEPSVYAISVVGFGTPGMELLNGVLNASRIIGTNPKGKYGQEKDGRLLVEAVA